VGRELWKGELRLHRVSKTDLKNEGRDDAKKEETNFKRFEKKKVFCQGKQHDGLRGGGVRGLEPGGGAL